MRYAGIAIALLAAWGGLTLLTTAGLSQKTTEHPEAKYEALVTELMQASNDYLTARHRALENTPPEQRTAVLAQVPDGRVNVLRKIDALAESTLDTPAGAEIAIGAYNWSWQLDADLDRLITRFARLVEHYPSHPDLVDAVGSVAQAYTTSGTPEAWISLLERLSRTTRDEDLRVGALYIMGQVQMNAKQLAAAKETFRKIITAYPRSEYAARAKGLIYEIDHLQPGMVAPYFTTRTIDNEPLSLESLRGKIVLVNFWATWCPTCVSEIPHLRDVYGRLQQGDPPFEIVNISLDEDLSLLKSLLRKLDMPGIQTWERREGENPVAKQYNVYGLPSWFLIDDKGVIRARDPFGDKLEESVAALRR